MVARQHGGGDSEENLALACERCNLCKGTNLSSVDPYTTQVVRLFNPRRDTWAEHWIVEGARIVGLTPVGRATARLLRMNQRDRVELRQALIEERGA